MHKVFTINPGSTSTKIALFADETMIFSTTVSHDAGKLDAFGDLSEQLPYRKETILEILKEKQIDLSGTAAFVGRGGGLLPLEGGTYEIDEVLLDHARRGANGITHPAQLGSQLAEEFRVEFGGRGFVVNPPDVDEYQDIARVTGVKEIVRSSHVHALNQKETAIRHAAHIGKKYEDCNFVVAHIGGGISIVAHRRGRMVDGNDNVGGEAALGPTRIGSVPVDPLVRLCFSGKYTEKELLARCTRNGGFVDHFGTADALEISNRAGDGDKHARLVWDTMIYQIAKYIGSMAAVLKGEVDGVLLTGGISRDKELVAQLKDYCAFIAPVTVYPGEFEMEAMANGALRVLEGKEEAKHYTGKPVWNGFRFE